MPVLQDIMAYVPWPGFGPFESQEPEHTVAGGERLSSPASTSTCSSRPATAPATSPTRSPTSSALFSGDVLFQSSVGRIDLPGGDHARCCASIATLLDALRRRHAVHPGHMGLTTLGAERAHNPFLTELARL